MEPSTVDTLVRVLFACLLLGGYVAFVIARLDRAHEPPRNRRVSDSASVSSSGIREVATPRNVKRAASARQGGRAS
ncbi:hypothetical protein [Sandaracinus amylolyticus]|uniref:Uncharacterized protein n=1 Tax=Sandaracinus amylolyticus TaxID=927083 RepID=A0A0F6W6R9_9BACT|nr:hypothetical protein [Sandaracinus amylolyticus]AKF08861.1 hypothetical protein DB32_006010 [Sandaracinus amylolyticus]